MPPWNTGLPWYVDALLIVLAYLLGSFPAGYLAGKWLKGIDIRTEGSGSTGATNVLRTLGTGPGIVVLAIDVLKGVLAIWAVRWAYSLGLSSDSTPAAIAAIAPADIATWRDWMITLAGIAAILGHSKSIWLGFTGGKSVATSLGILVSMSWVVGLGTLGVFLVVLAVFRIVSLGSIAGAIAVTGFMLVTQQPLPYILFGLAGGLYVIVRHRANLQRLLAGTEPRIGQKLADSSPESPTS